MTNWKEALMEYIATDDFGLPFSKAGLAYIKLKMETFCKQWDDQNAAVIQRR